MYHNNFFTEEQWECIRVCVANAPIPYDITLKKIPVEILDKIGQPKRVQHEGEVMVEVIWSSINEQCWIRSCILDSTISISSSKTRSV